MTKSIVSGIQPTGNIHLGNYLGAISSWQNLQNHPEAGNIFFGIMDLHSITIKQDPAQLKQNIFDICAIYLASNLDLEKTTIFAQSSIKEHAELCWLLSTITPMGWLNRMTQYKDKIKENNSNENLGLYAYPVLMAADILLYKADIVPVGDDQKQHLELTRDLAGAFNREFNVEYFTLPKPLIQKNAARIMSLQDGSKKMSKSDISDLSRINLSDDADLIVKKIKKAKTDSISGISYDKDRREIFNLLNIFASVSDKKPEEIAQQYENSQTGKFKNDVADAIIEFLAPIQNKISQFKQNPDLIREILAKGQNKASEVAARNIREIKDIIGLY